MLSIGMAVEILPSAREYRQKYAGRVGVVSSIYAGSPVIGIQFDNLKNPASKYGFFWFNEKGLRSTLKNESEEIIMLKGYSTAQIKFMDETSSNRTYSYALYDSAIQKGDTVVVQTGHHGLALAIVEDISPESSSKAQHGREVVCRVDFAAYNARKERAERLGTLKRTMDEKVAELQHNAIYEMLAEKDPALKAMLEEYKALVANG